MTSAPDRDRSRRIGELFARACDLGPEARDALLARECADDPALCAEILSLLQADADPLPVESLVFDVRELDVPERSEPSTFDATRSGLPDRIGEFRIVRQVGAGATGVVFEAEQDSPRRRVALKLLRAEVATSRMHARLLREADLLARLESPGTARIYQSGTVDIDGRPRPYIAMELVEGEQILAHAASHGLELRARLELMARTCEAVGQAHSAGVVHRDLKPQNVLVTPDGQPKVLDFGIARMVDPEVAATATATHHGHIFGTLAYMAPEQIVPGEREISARADVHALGVLLHELLAQHPFHDAMRSSVAELVRAIREDEPPLLGDVDPRLSGGVEAIAAKAVEKDPVRRYADAGAMAADLRRLLATGSVAASRQGTLRRVRRLARRHRRAVVTGGAVLVTLAAGLLATSFMWARSVRSERAERVAANEARWQSFRSAVRGAAASLEAGDVAAAQEALDSAPAGFADWTTSYLRAQLDTSVATLALGRAPVDQIVALADASYVAHVERGSTWRIADPTSPGTAVRIQSWIEAPALDAAGRLVAVACRDAGPLHIVDAGSGEVLDALPLDDPCPHRFAAASAGSRVLSVQHVPDAAVVLWDRHRRSTTVVLSSLFEAAWSLVVNEAGDAGAMGTEYGTLYFLELGDLPRSRQLPAAHGGHVAALAMDASGRTALSGARDHSAATWDVPTGTRLATLQGHVGEVSSAALSRDGTIAVTGSHDRTVRVWEARTGRLLATCRGHVSRVTSVAVSTDGGEILAGAEDGTLRAWRTSLAVPATVLRGHSSFVYDVAASPRDPWIASASWDGSIRLWDARTCASIAVLTPRADGLPFMRSVAFDARGERLAAGGNQGGHIWIWDASSQGLLARFPVGARVESVTWSPEGLLLAALDDSSVVACDVASASVVRRLQTREAGAALAVAVDAAGSRLAVGHADGRIVLRDPRTFEARATLQGRGGVWDLAFSPDGALLASASSGGELRLWDATTGEARQVLSSGGDEAYAVAFHPDGTRLATGAADATVRLWDVEHGHELLTLRGHASYVHATCFTGDGRTLISASGDGTLRAWHADGVREPIVAQR